MQRPGGSRQRTKGQRTSRPKARKAPTAHVSTDLQEQLNRRTHERDEALEQQAATAEVLKVISRSTFNLPKVLNSLVESAARLCEADAGVIRRREGDNYLVAATFGLNEQQRDHLDHYATKPDRGSVFGRTIIEGRTVHIPDVVSDPEYNRPRLQDFVSVRAALGVPLLREGTVVGFLGLWRREPRPFSQKQIELIETFAAQAVIAIENTRLVNELRQRTDDLSESLQQQTATADVLTVIASSTGELVPVFSAMLANAAKLCEATYGVLWLCEGDAFRTAALHGPFPQAYIDRLRPGTLFRPGPEVLLSLVAASGQSLQVPDLRIDASYLSGDPLPVAAAEIAGIRTLLVVPMIKGKELVGAIGI